MVCGRLVKNESQWHFFSFVAEGPERSCQSMSGLHTVGQRAKGTKWAGQQRGASTATGFHEV